jgi:AAA+ superfamily predicted ATPase
MTTSNGDWFEANRRYLAAEIGRVAARVSDEAPAATEPPSPVEGRPFRLDLLADGFSLSAFEREVVAMTAGVELDGEIARVVGRPTAAVALERLEDPHWSALAPDGTLRRWRFVEPRGDEPLVSAALVIDEPLLHWLTGASETSSVAAHEATAIADTCLLPDAYLEVANALAARLRAGSPTPVFALAGGDRAARMGVARAAAEQVGLRAWLLDAEAIPADPAERRSHVRLWERELVLAKIVPVIDAGDHRAPVVAQFADQFAGPLFLIGHAAETQRGSVRVDLPAIPFTARRALWADALGEREASPALDRLSWQFAIAPADIAHAAAEARLADGDVPLLDRAWHQARLRTRQDAGSFVRQVISDVTLDDLVLPAAQRRSLDAIAAQVRQQAVVYGDWNLQGKTTRGLGITALFSGPSGSGKTTAAEALAGHLRLDLLHIDLSQVVSKYIGETEKHLDRVFAVAEASGAILLFDEADALFGKRSEVHDSHDRYANLEVSYLLQRMDSYRGLAILTTNQKSGIDDAFLRRIRFVIHFPFPDRAAREELWRRALPATVLAEEPDWAELSRLSVSGGSIRNIALNAAFHAAEDGVKVGRTHLLRAVSTEGAKTEAPQMVLQMARPKS